MTKTLLMISTALAGLAMAPQAYAQDAQPAQAARAAAIQEVIVTARKRAENVQDVPIAITAVTAQTLEAHGFTSLGDVQKLTPSLQMLPSVGLGTAIKPSLRGQYQNDFNPTVDNSVATYVDGVLMARASGLNLNFPDIERIEVLRGPQGTLFGRNTTGGAISVTTADPVHGRTFGKLKAGYGNYNAVQLQGSLNAPIAGDVLTARLSAFYQRHKGYDRVVNDPTLTPVAGQRLNSLDSLGLQAKIRYTPNSTIDLVVKGDYVRESNRGPGGHVMGYLPTFPAAARTLVGPVAPLTGNPNPFNTSFIPVDKVKEYGLSTILTVDLNEAAQLKFIGSYRKMDFLYAFDIDVSNAVFLSQIVPTKDDVYTAEVQLTGKVLDGAVDYAAGLYYFKESGSNDQAVVQPVPTWIPSYLERNGFVTSYGAGGDFKAQSIAGYGQATWHATDKLDLTAGIRYTHDVKDLTTINRLVATVGGVNGYNCRSITSFTPFFSPTVAGCAQALPSAKASATNYNLTAQYKIMPRTMVYARMATGFRAGGQNIGGTNPATYQPFGPEKVKEYEVGLKGDFFDRRLRTNVAAYLDDYNDIQRTVARSIPGAIPPTQIVTVNAAKGRVKGVEVEITAVPTDQLTLGGSVGYIDAQYRRFTAAGQTNPAAVVDRKDEHFPGAPRWTASVYGEYTWPLENGELVAHADYSMHSRFQVSVATPFADTWTNSNMFAPKGGELAGRLAWNMNEPKNLSVAVWVKNLLNDRFVVAGTPGVGARAGFYNNPRTFGVEATYRFGD